MGASQNYKDICCYYNLRGQGSYGSWKTLKVLEFKYFSFRTWKAKSWNLVVGDMESHGKLWYVWYVNYCRCRSKDNIKYRQVMSESTSG